MMLNTPKTVILHVIQQLKSIIVPHKQTDVHGLE